MSLLLEALLWIHEPAYQFQRFKLLSKYVPAHAHITLKMSITQVLVTSAGYQGKISSHIHLSTRLLSHFGKAFTSTHQCQQSFSFSVGELVGAERKKKKKVV